jgi:hypothetical protein
MGPGSRTRIPYGEAIQVLMHIARQSYSSRVNTDLFDDTTEKSKLGEHSGKLYCTPVNNLSPSVDLSRVQSAQAVPTAEGTPY